MKASKKAVTAWIFAILSFLGIVSPLAGIILSVIALIFAGLAERAGYVFIARLIAILGLALSVLGYTLGVILDYLGLI